jgi:hypothetical protein
MISPMVTAILALRPGLQACPDELRKRVQSIRVRSAQESHGQRGSNEVGAWRNRGSQPAAQSVPNRWRGSGNTSNNGSQSSGSGHGSRPINRFQSAQSCPSEVPMQIHRPPSFQNSLNLSHSPNMTQTPGFPMSPTTSQTPTSPPARYISKFHNGSKTGDDQILNTIILNKLNVFSVKTYEDVKQFLFQILGSDQREFTREFTWLVFRKAAAEEKFCALFAKLLSEIQKEYPVILEEMRNLHTTYLDIWDISDAPDAKVDRRCRLGYSQFLAELTALGVLESDTMKKTLETLKNCIADCLSEECHSETVEEYIDCLRQLCGSKVPKPVREMIREILMEDLNTWISSTKPMVPGLSTKSRFACMDLRDVLMK